MRVGIWMFGYLPKIGGAQISAHSLANSLTKIGHQATVYADENLLTQCDARGWKFEYETRGLSTLPFRMGRRLGSPGRWLGGNMLARTAEADHLDVIQVVGLWPWATLLPSVRRSVGIPIAIRAAGDDIQVSDEVGYGVRRDADVESHLRSALTAVDLAVAISETVVEEYANLGVPKDRMEVIPPGVDFAAFQSGEPREQVRKRYGWPSGIPLIISVGRNHPKKGFADLIRALAKLNGGSRRYALAIIGDRTEELRPLANDLGVGESFFPTSVVAARPENSGGTFPSRDLIDIYRAADCFVLPSLIETYANVALEAMAAGVPAVVTDAPGCRDTVVDGEDGLVVPVSEPEGIAAAIERIINESELRRRLIDAGLAKAQGQDWDAIARRYVEVYSVLARR